jgi:very-short-patch-repair endonuclease
MEHGFPRPVVNVAVDGLPRRVEVDFLFADHRVILEADGARYHDHRLARQTDAAKQATLEAAGYRVVRLSWCQVTREVEQTVRRLRHVLGAPGVR